MAFYQLYVVIHKNTGFWRMIRDFSEIMRSEYYAEKRAQRQAKLRETFSSGLYISGFSGF